jgi:hypothetical protein
MTTDKIKLSEALREVIAEVQDAPSIANWLMKYSRQILAALELAEKAEVAEQRKQRRKMRTEALLDFGVHEHESIRIKKGFIVCVDSVPFRDAPGEPDDYGEQQRLIIEETADEAKVMWLEDAIEELSGEDWEIVDLKTGEVVKSGSCADKGATEYER